MPDRRVDAKIEVNKVFGVKPETTKGISEQSGDSQTDS